MCSFSYYWSYYLWDTYPKGIIEKAASEKLLLRQQKKWMEVKGKNFLWKIKQKSHFIVQSVLNKVFYNYFSLHQPSQLTFLRVFRIFASRYVDSWLVGLFLIYFCCLYFPQSEISVLFQCTVHGFNVTNRIKDSLSLTLWKLSSIHLLVLFYFQSSYLFFFFLLSDN